jgi:integrase
MFRRKGRETWDVRVPTDTGHWITRSAGTKDRSTAQSIERMVQELGARGQRRWDLLGAVADDRLTLPQLWDAWRRGDAETVLARLYDRDLCAFLDRWSATILQPATRARYRQQVASLVGEGFRLSHLSPDRIDRWLASVGTTGSTRARYFAALSSFISYLRSLGILSADPLASLSRPKSNPPREQHLELADVKKVVDGAEGAHRVLCALAYGAGAELSAGLAARVEWTDLSRKTTRLVGTKNVWRDRSARIAEWAWPIIQERCEESETGLLVYEKRRPDEWSKLHSAHLKALGFAGYTLHDARHHFAVRMIRAGTPAEMVARQLGHRDAMMVLKVYGKFSPSDEERDRWEQRATLMENG